MGTELQLDLLGNAYSFLDESMKNAAYSADDAWQWKFAVVNAAQAIELLLKERLRREHELLVYTNIDKPRQHTVSIDLALDRLKKCGITLPEEDIARLRRAKDIRNAIVHFELATTAEQLRAAYIDLFEFAHVFHYEHIGAELHSHIKEELWPMEAELMEEFRRDFITYQGWEMSKTFATELVTAQFYPYFVSDDGQKWERIRYGTDWPAGRTSDYHQLSNCHDCGAIPGQYHADGCDCEQCPRCKGQLLSCDCEIDWPDPDESNNDPTSLA